MKDGSARNAERCIRRLGFSAKSATKTPTKQSGRAATHSAFLGLVRGIERARRTKVVQGGTISRNAVMGIERV